MSDFNKNEGRWDKRQSLDAVSGPLVSAKVRKVVLVFASAWAL